MMESLKSNKFTYTKLTPEEQKRRGILGRLTGIIASTKEPTRNGRKYSMELWQKVFEDPIMQEKIQTRCVLGELGHPADRTEIDIEKIAICLAEVPKCGTDGNLYGVFDILDTPNGRILKTLCDYGTIIGVSSRGQGDLVQDYNGEESVDPETYDCECWDAVLVPAVKSARMSYIKEDVDLRGLKMKRALTESFNKASEEDKKVMKETLNNLNINLDNKDVKDPEDKEEEVKEVVEEIEEAVDDGSKDLVNNLKEALKKNADLEKGIKSLQEKLAVSDALVNDLKEECNRYKKGLTRVSLVAKSSKGLKEKVSDLTESLEKANKTIEEREETINSQKARICRLVEDRKATVKNSTLTESVQKDDKQVKELNESLNAMKAASEKTIKGLNEQLQKKDAENNKVVKQLNESITKQKNLTEAYKKLANTTVNKYIDVKATMLGMSAIDIKRKLGESYSIEDVDQVCESLKEYQLNVSRLPINLVDNRKVSVRVNESVKNPIVRAEAKYEDDCVDNGLMKLAGL